MFLGVDIGTSGVKAVLVDEAGAVAGQATAPLGVSRPEPLWSEQSPDDWWACATRAVRALDPTLRRRVRGVGLAGQMHGAVLLGANDRPLRPAILWNDGRSFAECAEMEAAAPDLRAVTGNRAMPGFTAPKLLWVRRHETEIFAQVRRILLPKDYVRLRLTGDAASDVSDSAGTLWLDVGARAWSEQLLDVCGLTRDHMPTLHEGTAATGRLTAEAAALWGLDPVPVAAGGGDNAAGAAGVGVVGEGQALLSLGTSGVIFVATDSFRPNPARGMHAFCHCLPDAWHQMAVHLSAASCVDWVGRLTGAADPGEVFARAEASGVSRGAELFLPYLSGERTPHNDPHVRGAFLNLDHDTDAGRLSQAVLEGVAFSLADGLDAIREAGTTIARLSVIGGGARSAYWGRILAAVLNTPLVYLDGGEVGPALGAARLAHAAVEPGAIADIFVAPAISRVVEPEAELRERLLAKQPAFRAAYARIHPEPAGWR